MKPLSKRTLWLGASAMLAPGLVLAADSVNVNGYADIIYTATDDTSSEDANGKNTTEGKFNATAEVDFQSALTDTASVRVDVDLDLGGGTSGDIEQAYFANKFTDTVTLIGGVFNSPIGWEAEDAPDMYQISHGQIYDILDGQTALHGNNVAGVAVAAGFGPTSITVALLNDLQQSNEEHSAALALHLYPMDGLDVELGYVTQASRDDSANTGTYGSQGTVVGSAENVTDINATYKWGGLTLGVEYLTAEKVVDAAYAVVGNYDFGNRFGATVRYDTVSYGDPFSSLEDTMTTTVAVSYTVADNLSAALEWRTQDDDNDTSSGPGGGIISDGDLVQLEFVAKF